MRKTDKQKKLLYSYISELIDKEIEKPDADIGFIEKMNGILDTLDKGASAPDKVIKHMKMKELRKACDKNYSRAKPRRRVTVAAVIVAVTILLGTLVGADISGFTPADIITRMKETIVGLKAGDSIDVDGVTYTYNGDAVKYDTVEECLKAEGVSLCYPSLLPDGVTLEHISVINSSGEKKLNYKFNDSSIRLAAHSSYKESGYADNAEYEERQIGDLTVYYDLVWPGSEEHAVVFVDDVGYSVTAKDTETIELIIKGLRKVN